MLGSTDVANTPNPSTNVLARSGQVQMFINADSNTAMNANAIGSAGGSQPHTNMQPYLALNFIISMFGIFPSQT